VLDAGEINATLTKYVCNGTAGSDGIPIGTIMAFGGISVPTGWLLCDGTQVSRTTYSGLFSVIGTSFGSGNGSSTFHLPDLRGRFLRGVDGSAGNDPDKSTRTAMNSGGNTGNNVGSIQSDELKSHSHGLNVNRDGNTGAGGGLSSGALYIVNSTNASGGSETRPKNANVFFIIKF